MTEGARAGGMAAVGAVGRDAASGERGAGEASDRRGGTGEDAAHAQSPGIGVLLPLAH